MNKFESKIYGIRYLGRLLAKIKAKYTGGEMQSKFLREYTKKFYNVDVGMYSYGSCFHSNFCSGGGVTIGRYCSIANRVYYIGFDHPMNLISTSPLFFENGYLNKFGINIDDQSKYQHLTIGNDVWIGSDVTILSKCHNIGDGAIIGAGSLVCSDIPAYAIAVGNPVKVIKYRFDNKTQELIQKSHWWECEPDEIICFFKESQDPVYIAKKISEKKK